MDPKSNDPDQVFAQVSASLRAWLRLPSADAADIEQDAWKEALQYGPDLWAMSPAALLAYLKKCAVTAISRRARKSGDALRHVAARLAEDIDAEAGEVGVPALHREGDDTMGRVTAAERAAVLRAAMAKLNPAQRLRLTLFYTYDLSPADIGRVLGCSASSVDNSNSRAYKRLRALLPDEAHLGGEAEEATATLWFEGGRSVDLRVLGAAVRVLPTGTSLFVELSAPAPQHDAAPLAVPECWAIVHPNAGDISPPLRALWTPSSTRGATTLQMPDVAGADAGVKQVFVFAGPLP
jgi:RNA polymerase sigma factor (sigma-70 family)